MENAKKKLLTFLKMGMTPERLAFSIALGIVLGIVPALGMATLFCTMAAFAFRLNLAAIQLVNFFVYPLQLALLIPFMRAGEWFFGTRPLDLSLEKIQVMLKADLWTTVFHLSATTLRALGIWIIVAPAILAAAYVILLPLLRKLKPDRIAAGPVTSA